MNSARSRSPLEGIEAAPSEPIPIPPSRLDWVPVERTLHREEGEPARPDDGAIEMIRATHGRAVGHKARAPFASPHPARPRSGTFRTRPRLASGAPTPWEGSPGPTVACGIVGLVLFPIAGAAMMGRLVGAEVFVPLAALAGLLVYGAVVKLELDALPRLFPRPRRGPQPSTRAAAGAQA